MDNNKKVLIEGWHVANQTPIDDRLVVDTYEDLLDLGTDDYKVYRYYQGLKVLVKETLTEYIWLESSVGELPSSFVYPSNIASHGVDYSNKSYNFVKFDSNSNIYEVDVHTVAPLTNYTYASGSNSSLPGKGAILQSSGVEIFPTLQGLAPYVGMKILVKDQTSVYLNGDYTLEIIGNGTSAGWRLRRINYLASQFYPKLWLISRGSLQAKKIYQQTNKDLTDANIGISGNISFVMLFNGYKSVLEFGATGNGTTNDRAAFQSAIDYCIQNNKSLYVPAGTYIINTQENNTQTPLRIDRLTANGQSLHMFGEGKGKTIIKEQNGCLDAAWSVSLANANFNRLFYCYMRTTTYEGGHYVFKGITFDKNNRSNTITPGDATGDKNSFENASIIQFSGDQGMPSIKSVTIEDCEFVDKMGPCVNLSTSNVDVYNLVINNCYSIDHPTVINNPTRWEHREDFGLAIDCDNTVIENTTCLYAQIEPTVESSSTRVRRYKMTNSKINILEFTEGGTGGDYTFVDLNNIHVSDSVTFRGMHVTATNSILKAPLSTNGIDPTYLSPLTMKVTNSRILLNNISGDVKPLYIKHANVPSGQTDFAFLASADFVNCDIVIDSTGAVTSGYAVKSALSTTAQSAPCPVTFDNCRFDSRLYGVFNAYNTGGNFTFNNCVLAGTTYAFSAGTQSDKVSKLTINNCDFSKVTGTNILINRPTLSGGNFQLIINGTYKTSEWSYASSGSANIDAYYKAKPKLIGSTYPTTGYWFKGDVVYNDFTSSTDVGGWVCTAEGTSGTWLSFGATNLTKSYVDTQLSSKQSTLVSGVNIKTINGSSILGAGNLTVNSALVGNASLFTFSFVDSPTTFYTEPAPGFGPLDITTITKIIFENSSNPTGTKDWLSQITSGSLIQIGIDSSNYAIYNVNSVSTGVIGEDSIPVRNISVSYLLGSGGINTGTDYPISFIKSTPESAVNAGPGTVYFLTDNTAGFGTYEYMSKTPDSSAEVEESVVVNNNTVLIHEYISDVTINKTAIDSGIWEFNFFGYVNNYHATFFINVYKRTSGGTETLLFSAETQLIDWTSVDLATATTVQQQFSCSTADKLVVKIYGKTTQNTNVTLKLVHSGTTHYSHLHTPLVLNHNDIAGLQGGIANEYYHLTSSDYTTLTSWISTGVPDNKLVSTFVKANGTVALTSNWNAGSYKITTNELASTIDSTFNGVVVGRGSGNVVSNTTVGLNALYSNTSGDKNTAVGAFSLKFNTIGVDNTALGMNTLYSNISGNENVAIGNSALYLNNANDNTGVGSFCFRYNTTGYANTGIGRSSLYSNDTGNENVAVGKTSLYNNISGSRNIALGMSAGNTLADGSTANTAPANSIFIGYDTKSLTATDTNQIVIGYAAIGNGSNTVTLGNNSVVDTYLRGAVHFNGAYKLPSTDGTNGQVLSTDGAGTVVWSTVSGGGGGSGTVTSVAALTIGTTGTDISSTVATSTTTPVITLNIPTASATNRGALSSTDWNTFNGKQAALGGTGFVKISGTTISYDNSSYLTGNQNITLSGDVTGSGATSITTSISASVVTGKALTGFVSGSGTVVATDTILQAINKLDGNIGTKQATLVSGTNIKTLNGNSLLGSGNITISSPFSGNTLGMTYGTPDTSGNFSLSSFTASAVTFFRVYSGDTTYYTNWLSQATVGSFLQVSESQSVVGLYSITSIVYDAGNSWYTFNVSAVYGSGTFTFGNTSFVSFKKQNLTIKDESSSLTVKATSINFTGDGVTATASGDDITVTIPGSTSSVSLGLIQSIATFNYLT